MSPESVTVTFRNWEKWNPRKDIKHPVWFALSNRITEDDDMQTLSDAEFRAFIHLACLASQKAKSTVLVNLEKAARISGIKRSTFIEAIEKLSMLSVISSTHVRDPYAKRTDDVRDPNTTNKTDKTNKQMFDFDIPYGFYPRKAGKDAGITRLKKRITSQEDFDLFTHACKAYAAECRREGRDKKFIMLFSTFVGTEGAERWLDHVPSTSPPPPPTSQASGAFFQEPEPSEKPLTPEESARFREQLRERFGKAEI